MKTLILLFTLIPFLAHANVCDYSYSSDFEVDAEAGRFQFLGESSNHQKFTVLEKRMIHKAVTLQGYLSDLNEADALIEFGDFRRWNGQISTVPGDMAGSIRYYMINSKKIALVLHYPGENTYGAFFEVKSASEFKLLAQVADSDVYCKH